MSVKDPRLRSKNSINDFNINFQSFITEKKDKISAHYNLLTPPIGKGSFGEVRKGIHKQTGLYILV